MLTKLYLNNCFTHSDKTFTFENGLTGVIGPNESGKSLIVEMVRYALFGSKALRGKSEDYKKLHVELDFTVGGADYHVIRKGTKITLEGGEQKVSGTKPVDEAIRKILGYDLNVFDVANACNQGNVEALSEMTPTARKAMVDKTVGLTVLDDLISFAGQEGNALKREAQGMGAGMVEPTSPVQPEYYLPAASVVSRLKEAQNLLTEFNQLAGFLSQAPRTPEEPEACDVDATSAELAVYQENRANIERSLRALEGNLRVIEPELYSADCLNSFEAMHDAADRWKQKERLLAQGHHCCPKCDHSWPIADLGNLADAELAEAPDHSRRDIEVLRARIGNGEKIHGLQININGLEEELNGMPCRADHLALVRDHEAKVSTYNSQLAAWNAYNEGLEAKATRFNELQGIDQTVVALQSELQQAQQFEHDLARFRSDMVDYESRLEQVADLTNRSEEFLRAREIIKALKVSVKSHLLPSLNKVASVLLSQMTGGERYMVEVDDEFEIMIDGQRIGTLSGSGKAVANLAIRIALGQILTNRVFSVFMADEVDASMDDDRADYTAKALRRLTATINQVITITHKRPETDHTFELKK
jgi:exonuclease SbcC